MKPSNIESEIFLDGGDPGETKEIFNLLGFLDGQTTNPTLIAKNPSARDRLQRGEKFGNEEVLTFYRDVVQELSALIPQGSISIEVYADAATPAETMLQQGKEMYSWIPNAHIKLPTTKAGLHAAERAVKEGLRVNMTLCFTQEQAAAVYAATKGTKPGDVFVSPFVGRLDDRGENGMDVIANILKMYQKGDGHVKVLTASVRSMDHFLYALFLKSDIITAPFKVLKEWGEKGLPLPSDDYFYSRNDLKEIPYKGIDLTQPWANREIFHDLTDQGLDKFSADWISLIR